MSDTKKNPPHDPASLESEFDVFKRDGSTRLPHQRFVDSALAGTKRTGAIQPRILTDLREAPEALRKALSMTELQQTDPVLPGADAEQPLTIRLQTYQVDLAERIARVKSEQKDALDGLQQLEDDQKDEGDKQRPD